MFPVSRFVKDKDEDEDNNTKFENERENITTETTIESELLKSSVSQSLYKDVLSIIEKEKNSQVKRSSLYIMLNISKETFLIRTFMFVMINVLIKGISFLCLSIRAKIFTDINKKKKANKNNNIN